MSLVKTQGESVAQGQSLLEALNSIASPAKNKNLKEKNF